MKKSLFFCISLIICTVSSFAQNESALLALLGEKATETASELLIKINSVSTDNNPVYVEITNFKYKGFQVPFSQVWTRLLQDKIVDKGDRRIRILVTGSHNQPPAGFRVTGEILDIGNTLSIHNDLINTEDMTIIGNIHCQIEKTADVTALLFDAQALSSGIFPDAYEPDSPENAVRISLSSGSLHRSLTSGDEDWFALDFEGATNVRVYTTGSIDTVLELYDYNGSPGEMLAEDDDSGDDENASLFISSSMGNNLRVKVKGYENASGVYDIHVSEIVPLDDAYEPNDSRETAMALAINSQPVSTAFYHSQDIDWFTFDIADTKPVFVTMYTTGNLDTYITLYDKNLEEIGNNDDGQDDYNAYLTTFLSQGTYYVKIHELDSATGYYSIHLETRNVSPDQYEPDNSILKPSEIRKGETQTRNFIPSDDQDWVKFTISASTQVVLYTEGPIDTFLTIFDSDGDTVCEDDDGGEDYNARITASLDAGTYYIQIHSLDSIRTGDDYRLVFE